MARQQPTLLPGVRDREVKSSGGQTGRSGSRSRPAATTSSSTGARCSSADRPVGCSPRPRGHRGGGPRRRALRQRKTTAADTACYRVQQSPACSSGDGRQEKPRHAGLSSVRTGYSASGPPGPPRCAPLWVALALESRTGHLCNGEGICDCSASEEPGASQKVPICSDYAPRETRTPTGHTSHKALNLARLPIPPQARAGGAV
jgi:hypothetical protein